MRQKSIKSKRKPSPAKGTSDVHETPETEPMNFDELELGQLQHLRLIAALNENEITEEEFLQGLRFCLFESLKRGDVMAAKALRHEAVRIYDEGTAAGYLFQLETEHLNSLYSVQTDPDQLVRVEHIKGVQQECGPFYLGPSLSFEPRPAGWARAADEGRVLSWHDEGFGLVGDQLANVRFRVMSSKPLTRFQTALIAGPFEPPDDTIPEEMSEPDWKRFNLDPQHLNIRAFRRFCLETGTICNDLHLTKRYAARQHRIEALVRIFSDLDNYSPKVRGEIYLARAAFKTDAREREGFLSKAVACDSSLRQRAELLKLWGKIQEATTVGDSNNRTIGLGDLLDSLRDFPASNSAERALCAAATLQLQPPASFAEILDVLSPFEKVLQRVETPYESLALQRSCQSVFNQVVQDDPEAVQDPSVLHEAIACGFRPNGQSIAIKACDPDYLAVLEQLLRLGLYPRGWLSPIGVYVPIGTAVSDQNLAGVRMLLKHGADPLEPTHYGGASFLQLAHQGGPDMMALLSNERE